MPLSGYVLRELIMLTRRTTMADMVLEFEDLHASAPTLDIDMDAVRASFLYTQAV